MEKTRSSIYLLDQFTMARVEDLAENVAHHDRANRSCVSDDLGRFFDER